MITLYPTDTLYGLGVDATSPKTVARLIALKGRPDGKPISVVVADMDMLRQCANVTPLAERLASQFLPGKLTLVLEALPEKFAPGIVAPDGSVGFRIPAHPAPHELVLRHGKPVTATSANVSGLPTESTVQKILEQFGEQASWIDDIIDGGELALSPGSTVVDARRDAPLVLREGAISKNEIEGPVC